MTSYPLVRRTLATLRMAELGFLGVRVMTWMHTPRRKGATSSAGDFDLRFNFERPFRTSWLIVGIAQTLQIIAPFPRKLEKRSADNTSFVSYCNYFLNNFLTRQRFLGQGRFRDLFFLDFHQRIQLHLAMIFVSGAGRDDVTHDHIFLEAMEVIHLGQSRRLGQNACRVLE